MGPPVAPHGTRGDPTAHTGRGATRRGLARPPTSRRARRRWRPTRPAHATGTGACGRALAGGRYTRTAPHNGRNGRWRPTEGRPRPRCRRAVAAPRRHRHLRKQGERGRVSRGRGGRWSRVEWRQLKHGATAARVANVRMKARTVAARAPRGGSRDGPCRGPRRCWRRLRRGRGCRRSSRCGWRRSRAAQRHLRGREGAVSAWPEGRQRAYLAPSSSCGGGRAPSGVPKK